MTDWPFFDKAGYLDFLFRAALFSCFWTHSSFMPCKWKQSLQPPQSILMSWHHLAFNQSKKSHLLVTLGKATLLASLPVGQVDITCVAKLGKDVKLSRNYLCLYLPCKVCKLVSGWLNAERILCNPRTPEQVLIGQSSETLWEPGHCNEIPRTCRSRRHRPLCFLPPEIFKIIPFSLLS